MFDNSRLNKLLKSENTNKAKLQKSTQANLKRALTTFVLFFILIAEKALCTTYDDCTLDLESCPHCLSGVKESVAETQCWIQGLCQGTLLYEVLYPPASEASRGVY